MADVDGFLASVLPPLTAADTAIHNGDADARRRHRRSRGGGGGRDGKRARRRVTIAAGSISGGEP
jgi:hypothetical protein